MWPRRSMFLPTCTRITPSRTSKNFQRAAAIPLYERSLAIKQKTLGPDHVDLTASLKALADLYERGRRHAETAPLYERLLAIEERTLPPDDPRLANTVRSLAFAYMQLKRYAEAAFLYQRVLALAEKAQGRLAHIELTSALDDLYQAYEKQARYADAEQVARRYLANRRGAPAEGRLDPGPHPSRLGAASVRAVHHGGVFLFSWPARGGWRTYLGDRNTVDLAQVHLKEFLESGVAKTKVARIHFVAHSMVEESWHVQVPL